MENNFQLLDILLFAAIAGFLFFRLRSVLGRRTGNERRRADQLTPRRTLADPVEPPSSDPARRWQGPPGPLVYTVLRSDAVDVVYGTVEGYEALGVPYMPHILPDRRG